MLRDHLRKLSELQVRKQYQIKFAALVILNDSEHVNRTSENIKQHIKTSTKDSRDLYELKQHKPWFDEERLRFLDQRKQVKCSGYRIQTKANYIV